MGKWISGGGVTELHEVNDEARNAEFVSITGVVEVDVVNGKTFSTNLEDDI